MGEMACCCQGNATMGMLTACLLHCAHTFQCQQVTQTDPGTEWNKVGETQNRCLKEPEAPRERTLPLYHMRGN